MYYKYVAKVNAKYIELSKIILLIYKLQISKYSKFFMKGSITIEVILDFEWPGIDNSTTYWVGKITQYSLISYSLALVIKRYSLSIYNNFLH